MLDNIVNELKTLQDQIDKTDNSLLSVDDIENISNKLFNILENLKIENKNEIDKD